MKRVKSTQTAGYNGVRMVYVFTSLGKVIHNRAAMTDFWQARPLQWRPPPPRSILQNPGKTLIWAVLPPVAALHKMREVIQLLGC